MATLHWQGKALAVKQKITVTVGGTLSAETFKLGLGDPTAGGVWIAEHTDATTVIADTVAALVAAWNASTHPWATGITATDASPDIVLEAAAAGVPFGTYMSDNGQTWETGVRGYHEIDLNTPGGSATLTQDETTANRGPHCANCADNWSTGTYPADDDDVRIADNAIDIKWGLDFGSDGTNKVTLFSLHADKTYTGKIGLDSAAFDGVTTAPEYRDTYFKIMVNKAEGEVRIGEHHGPGAALGSRRIMLDLKGAGCVVEMFGSNPQPFETGRPAVRILCDHTSGTNDIYIRGAEGGFGIAVDKPGETSVAYRLLFSAPSTAHKLYTGAGLELTGASMPFQMTGGYCRFKHVPSADGSANKVYKLQVDGGELWTEGDFTCHYLVNEGGTIVCNHYSSDSGSQYAIQYATLKAGTTETRRSLRARNWNNVQDYVDVHKLLMAGTVITVTTWTHTYGGGAAGA